MNRKQLVRPFDDVAVTETETNTPNRADYAQPCAWQSPYPRGYSGRDNLVRAGGMMTNVPPSRPRGQCWICRQVGCHSRNHDQRPSTQPPWTRSNICWTCCCCIYNSRVVDPGYIWRHDPQLHHSYLFSISRRETEQGLGGRATGTLLSQPEPNDVKQLEGHGFDAALHGGKFETGG